ncbi:MAG: transcription-repair coupling factor [Deltaproteobacteria bacterium]|nr:transcription-repair coupling factor [Deltaproteobacteria bacterium]
MNWSGLVGSSIPFAMAEHFRREQKPLLVLARTGVVADNLKMDLEFFLGSDAPVLSFPSYDVLPYYGLNPNPLLLAGRIKILFHLLHTRDPFILIVPVAALMRLLPPVGWLKDSKFTLAVGASIARDELTLQLLQLGYYETSLVEDVGSFSKRGGVMDIFPPHLEWPVRVEFFGDVIESIRYFNPENQRSQTELSEFQLIPAREVLLKPENVERALKKFRTLADEADIPKPKRAVFVDPLKEGGSLANLEAYLPLFYEKLNSLLDYLPARTTLIHLEPTELKQHWQELKENIEHAASRSETLEKLILPTQLYWHETDFQQRMSLRPRLPSRGKQSLFEDICIESLNTSSEISEDAVQTHDDLKVLLKGHPIDEHFLDPLKAKIQQWQTQGYFLNFTASGQSQGLRLEDLLERLGFEVSRQQKSFLDWQAGVKSPQKINLFEAVVSTGFVWPAKKIVLVTDEEIFGRKAKRVSAKFKKEQILNTFDELTPGQYVIHADHGVGIYKGLVQLKLEGIGNDYLLLEYLGGDKLYLPVYRLNLLHRYLSGESQIPVLDKLGGFNWQKTLAKAKNSIKAIAGELLRLYAERATLPGHAYPLGGVLMEEFESEFPFTETPDQGRAIREVAEDLQKSYPMDRLLCGDVGFGKTEVAMRAAYQVILNSKQVAVIVPTTVLAHQHFQSFRQRFKDTGVQIGMLSRFIDPHEQKAVLQKLSDQKIDLIIGTHRLLSPDVNFKDLGLVVVDEEHRFGVLQKEKLKKLTKQVDVLAMTATPIPRTLNMALSGIRDLSIISTPPEDRLSIRTYVCPYNEALIREVILREIARGGQVYFVHNRVQSIAGVYEQLKKIIPEAKIAVAHGQMDEGDLEEMMVKFVNHEVNVLLCTTIIESGLDVPTANTLIIDRADQMGLAQLYQLRGRVGRSNVRAYAYLLTPVQGQGQAPDQRSLTRDARARLTVIARYVELGSGFKIAAHDMEIRGIGNLLGEDQSGNLAAIGYEMYSHLLEEAIGELKGEEAALAPEPELKLRLDATIPAEYVSETTLRLTLYRRLAMANQPEEIEGILQEMRDRFGTPPTSLAALAKTMVLKVLAKKAWLRLLRQEKTRFVMAFDPRTPINTKSLHARCDKEPGRFKWISPHELAMGFKEGKEEMAFESLQKFLLSISA